MKLHSLFFCILILGCSASSIQQPIGCQESSDTDNKPSWYRLVCADTTQTGTVILVSRAVLKQSRTISDMMEEEWVNDSAEIPLDVKEHEMVAYIIPILRMLSEQSSIQAKAVQPWINQLGSQYNQMGVEQAAHCLAISNYLDLHPEITDFFAQQVVQGLYVDSDHSPLIKHEKAEQRWLSVKSQLGRDLYPLIGRYYYLAAQHMPRRSHTFNLTTHRWSYACDELSLSGINPKSFGFSLAQLIAAGKITPQDCFKENSIRLSHLHLNDLSGIEQLIPYGCPLSKMLYLELDDNCLQDFSLPEDVAQRLVNLRHIFLKGNPIELINNAIFDRFTKLESVELTGLTVQRPELK